MSLRKLSKTDWAIDVDYQDLYSIDVNATKEGVIVEGELIPWSDLATARQEVGLELWEDEDLARYLVERGVDLEAIGQLGASDADYIEIILHKGDERWGSSGQWIKQIAQLKLEPIIGTVSGDDPLPCPFCGSDKVTLWEATVEGRLIWCGFCEDCEGEGGHAGNRADAITAWNTRTNASWLRQIARLKLPPAEPDNRRDVAEAALSQLRGHIAGNPTLNTEWMEQVIEAGLGNKAHSFGWEKAVILSRDDADKLYQTASNNDEQDRCGNCQHGIAYVLPPNAQNQSEAEPEICQVCCGSDSRRVAEQIAGKIAQLRVEPPQEPAIELLSVEVSQDKLDAIDRHYSEWSRRQWKPIETAPTTVPVLLAWADGHVQVSELRNEETIWYEEAPTHWQPLPLAPNEKTPPTTTTITSAEGEAWAKANGWVKARESRRAPYVPPAPEEIREFHLTHCYQGEYGNECKYGDNDCPALPVTTRRSVEGGEGEAMDDKLKQELINAEIDLGVWQDPESWGDKENAFFWEREYRTLSKKDTEIRAELSELLDVPASWQCILPAIKKVSDD